MRRARSVGSGAAPDMSQRSDDVSYLRSTSGPSAMMRAIIVGTTVIEVMRSRSMSAQHLLRLEVAHQTQQPPTMKIMVTNAGASE